MEDVVVQVDTSAAEGLAGITLVPAPVLKYVVTARTYVGIDETTGPVVLHLENLRVD